LRWQSRRLIALWCLSFQPMPSLEAKVRQRDRGGWQMPADRAFALR
jgi:hypothetical protein